jgi:hypothetical protein
MCGGGWGGCVGERGEVMNRVVARVRVHSATTTKATFPQPKRRWARIKQFPSPQPPSPVTPTHLQRREVHEAVLDEVAQLAGRAHHHVRAHGLRVPHAANHRDDLREVRSGYRRAWRGAEWNGDERRRCKWQGRGGGVKEGG